MKDLNSISISLFLSNSEGNFGGGWKTSNSTEKDMKSHLDSICNFPQNFSLFLDCFEKNTFHANESFAKVKVNDQDIDLENLSPQLYDTWFSKFYVLNHSFAQKNESLTFYYNDIENVEYFIRKQFIYFFLIQSLVKNNFHEEVK